MIEKKDHPHRHQNGNGFTLGMLVGGAVVLLVTTEKGRKILKELSSMGMNAISGMKKDMEMVQEMEEAEDEIHSIEPMQEIKEEKSQKLLTHADEGKTPTHGRIRKFFKRNKKK